MVYLRLRSAELALRRIAARVRQGGHDVPRADVLRRFSRGRENFQRIYYLPAFGRQLGSARQFGACTTNIGEKSVKAKTRTKASRPLSFAAGVGRALRRAAKDAQKTARMYGTPLYVWENGKVVAKKP
jgi:hypothetical protein